MKRMIIVLGIVMLIAVAFIRGYIALSGPHRESQSNKVDVNVTVDPDKIKKDAQEVNKRVQDQFKNIDGKSEDADRPDQQSPDPAPDSR